ncbi:MAG: glycosyltransferase [Sphingobium sp.]
MLPPVSHHPHRAPSSIPSRRITLFLFDLSLTGVARNGVRLANALSARGHQVELMLCRDDGRAAHILAPDVTVTILGAAHHARLGRPAALAAALPALRAQLRQSRPWAFVSLGNHGHIAALAASLGLPGLRRIYRISNDPHHPGDGAVKRALRRLSLTLLARAADRLILVSPHLAETPPFRAATGKVVAIPNGVEAAEIRDMANQACPHPWLSDPDTPCILTIGRLSAQKNHETLIRALALTGRQRPVRLIILGQGSDKARTRLMTLAAELGVDRRVALLPPVANPFPYIGHATAFVLPSLWEGASNALLEAVACGVPIIASRTAGNAQDVLGYGRFGLLVDPLDIAALAKAIDWQTGTDPCRPGARADAFRADVAVGLTCRAILDAGAPLSPARQTIPTGTAIGA